MMKNTRQIGAYYEELATQYLEEKGYKILERNFYCRQGEIDLVAMDGAYLVFVEVKYRAGRGAGHPLEAVDVRKQNKISRAAVYYCYRHKIPDTRPCRFDVVSILDGEIEHIKNAFELYP